MPIIRSRHSFDSNYTTVPNAWVRDPRLSLKAKGLLVQLMSHSVGWTVSIGSLAQANDCGRDAIRSAVIELESAGYLIRSQDRSDTGQFAEVLWVTADPSDSPVTGNPTTANPTPKNNNTKEEQSQEELPHPEGEDEVDSRFEEFWSVYPRKVEKIDARKAFLTAYRENGEEVIDGARRMAADPNLPPRQFIPYPASWLRAGGWTNEPYPVREKSRQEIEAEERERIRRRDEAERERQRLAREKAQREIAEFVPPPRCEHDRIGFRCPECRDKYDTPDGMPQDDKPITP